MEPLLDILARVHGAVPPVGFQSVIFACLLLGFSEIFAPPGMHACTDGAHQKGDCQPARVRVRVREQNGPVPGHFTGGQTIKE